MSVYKKFNGKRVKRKNKDYNRGTWYYEFRLDRRRYHKSIPEAATRKQAVSAERAAKSAIFENKYQTLTDTTTFTEFVDDVYYDYIEQNNVNTYSKRVFTKVLVKYFGKKPIRDITPEDCRKFLRARQGTPTIHGRARKPASINKELSTLSKILNLAKQERKVESNPLEFVPMLKESKPRERILTVEEKTRFDEVLHEDPIPFRLSTIAMNTGLRRGQILAIKLAHIDFEREILLAVPSKGRDSRQIPLNQTMLRLFREIEDEKPEGRIFPFKEFRKRWNNAMQRIGIEDFHFHDLKHAFATELIRRGNSPELVQLLFAHSDKAVTEIYINQKVELMRPAVNTLDDVQEIQGKIA